MGMMGMTGGGAVVIGGATVTGGSAAPVRQGVEQKSWLKPLRWKAV